MQYCKPRCLSITDKTIRDFAQDLVFNRQFLIGYTFANCMRFSFFVGYRFANAIIITSSPFTEFLAPFAGFSRPV